jgi:hypothetical protein
MHHYSSKAFQQYQECNTGTMVWEISTTIPRVQHALGGLNMIKQNKLSSLMIEMDETT